jgi:hypothetical protein
MSTHIARNPFARETLTRTSVKAYGRTCTWCGSVSPRGLLFCYHIETDGGRKSTLTGEFCSIGCMRTYHGA